jgi:hypothetical protein
MSVIPDSSNINFVVNQFNNDFALTERGVLTTEEISLPTYDAEAVFNVNTADMRAVFQFQTDNTDINDVDATDLKYYTFLNQWPANLRLNVANAMMDDTNSSNAYGISQSDIPRSKFLLKHDFERYMALKLFGTIQGVDLFSNEMALSENMCYLGGDIEGSSVYADIRTSLASIASVDGTSPGLSADGNGLLFMSNATKDNSNIVRHLMLQIQANQPARFAEVQDSEGPQPVPLQTGDILNFTLIVSAKENQHTLTDVAEIPSRTYLIRLVLQDSATNTQVIDSALVGDYPYSPFAVSKVESSVVSSGAAPASLPADMAYMAGWYYESSGSDSITWEVPVGTAYDVADLQSVYATAHVKSLTSLPSIRIDTAGGSCVFDISGAGQITDNFDCQFAFNLDGSAYDSNSNFAILGYQQVTMSLRAGESIPSGQVTAITILSDETAGVEEAKFVVTTVAAITASGNSVAYLAPV